MESIFDAPPATVQNDLDRLKSALDQSIPKKKSSNVLIATWNIRKFGGLTREWRPTGKHSPTRDLRGLRAIIDIISRFDVVAVQEVTGNLRALRDTMKFLGKGWSFLMTDITLGDAGNKERLAYIFNNRRVQASGLAGEVVIPPKRLNKKEQKKEQKEEQKKALDLINEQFARTPYAVSFRAGKETFILLTAHIEYGKTTKKREAELRAIAKWLYDWAHRSSTIYHHNLLILGDFNIDREGGDLCKAFTSKGLRWPKDLDLVRRSIFSEEGDDPRLDKFYDQIAWFTSASGKIKLNMEYLRGGGFDFLPFVYSDTHLSKQSVSYRISDHYPLWVEFKKRG